MTKDPIARANARGSEPGLRENSLTAVRGRNFSGRTSVLRNFVGLGEGAASARDRGDGRDAYVGPEIYNALSGLVTSVEDEVRLHLERSRSSFDFDSLLDALGLTPVRSRNPFELSGGEQALTALAASLAFAPNCLALDCCFEQIDQDKREVVIEHLLRAVRSGTRAMIADNRLAEFSPDVFATVVSPDATRQHSEDWVAVGPVVSPMSLSDLRRAPSIRLDGIRYSYRGAASPVLLDISTTLEPGRVYLLDGANGSGKSTLAKLLAGVLRPQSGAMSLNGATFQPWREPGSVFAYHFQNPDLQLFSTTVRAEVEAGPRALRLSSDTIERAARVWENAFGLDGALDWHPLDLPFVCRKRVALAATFAMVRPWLILDEPTLGQDDETSETIRKMIGLLADQGCGVLVISHSVGFRERLASHRLVLKRGQLIEQ